MSMAVPEERPRQLSVPLPIPMHTAALGAQNSKASKDETVRALRAKLCEYQAENNLLGALVKDLKAEKDGLQLRLSTAAKRHEDGSRRAVSAQQVDAAGAEHKRLAAEVERLTSVVRSHAIRLQKAKQHQQELEDVALDLRAELDDAKSKQEVAESAAAAAVQRSTALEAKVEAAGLGPIPKMGPTAEQLVINSTQRIRELTEELAALRSEEEHRVADAQQKLEQATANALHEQQQLEKRLQEQLADTHQQNRRASEFEQRSKELQKQVIDLRVSIKDAHRSKEAYADLKRSHQALSDANHTLQQQLLQLQQHLASQEGAHATAIAQHQQRTAALEQDVQVMSANLAAVKQHEGSSRSSAADATTKIERLRSEMLRCVGELHSQLSLSATTGQQQQNLQQQLRAMESTAAAARAEAAETRQQLVELASATLSELREQVAGEAVAITGLPDGLNAEQLPAPVASYIKVLEQAVCGCERRSKQLLGDALTAQQFERETRKALASAREAQATAERALQQQTQRLLAAERMRLSDLKEQQSLEKRLALAQQECTSLRDTLLSRGSSTSLKPHAQLQTAACLATPVATSKPHVSAIDQGNLLQQSTDSGPYLPTGRAASKALRHAADACGSVLRETQTNGRVSGTIDALTKKAPEGKSKRLTAGAPAAADQLRFPPDEQQQDALQQHLGGVHPGHGPSNMLHTPAADAGHLGHNFAAHSAASISRYQAKLAQLRQMKEQLMHNTLRDVTCAVATHTADAQGNHHQQDTFPVGPPIHLGSMDTWEAGAADNDWRIGCGSSGGLQPSTSGTSAAGVSTVLNSSGGGSSNRSAAVQLPAQGASGVGQGIRCSKQAHGAPKAVTGSHGLAGRTSLQRWS